ncbi:MAG: hypothetical protein VB138_13365 [Burkholderia sp.]
MTHIVEKRIFEIQCRLFIRLCVSCMIALLLGKARVPLVNGSNRHAFVAARASGAGAPGGASRNLEKSAEILAGQGSHRVAPGSTRGACGPSSASINLTRESELVATGGQAAP